MSAAPTRPGLRLAASAITLALAGLGALPAPARADSVKGYLVNKGIDPATLATSGAGPDQPVASNDSADGRSRNRRIEFRVGRN